jgi:hypothetical protein
MRLRRSSGVRRRHAASIAENLFAPSLGHAIKRGPRCACVFASPVGKEENHRLDYDEEILMHYAWDKSTRNEAPMICGVVFQNVRNWVPVHRT